MGVGLRNARSRTAATVIAVVVLMCQAAAWVHAAATPHVTCLEHGESVHLKVQAAAFGRTRQSASPTLSSAVDSVAHAHEHCGLASQRSTSPSPSPTPSAALPPPCPARAPSAPALAVRFVLHLAPKTSPPRAPAA